MAYKNPHHYLYSTARWKRLRAEQLRKQPLCEYSLKLGRVVLATVVDHIVPHKGSEYLFYDAKNLQSLSKVMHDSAKRELERQGTQRGCDVDGNPLDPNTAWWGGG